MKKILTNFFGPSSLLSLRLEIRNIEKIWMAKQETDENSYDGKSFPVHITRPCHQYVPYLILSGLVMNRKCSVRWTLIHPLEDGWGGSVTMVMFAHESTWPPDCREMFTGSQRAVSRADESLDVVLHGEGYVIIPSRNVGPELGRRLGSLQGDLCPLAVQLSWKWTGSLTLLDDVSIDHWSLMTLVLTTGAWWR